MYNYHKTHHKSSYICECENRSLLRKGSPEGQKSVLTEPDWASPRQSSETAGEQANHTQSTEIASRPEHSNGRRKKTLRGLMALAARWWKRALGWWKQQAGW